MTHHPASVTAGRTSLDHGVKRLGAVATQLLLAGALMASGVAAEPVASSSGPRLEPAAYKPAMEDLAVAWAAAQATAHRDLRTYLAAEALRALERRESTIALGLQQRLDQLPPDVPTASHLLTAVPAPEGGPQRTSAVLDAWAARAREAAEAALLAQVRPLAEELSQAMAQADRAGDQERRRELWHLLAQLPSPWTAVPTQPVPGREEYRRQEALPLPTLPALVEITVAPGSHDLHIGIGGREEEEVTEIYLGGWFGHGSGIRASPGGDDVEHRMDFRGFQPDGPDPLADQGRLLDHWQGLAVSPYQPTVFRLAIAPAGVLVTRWERGRFVPVRSTTQLFNHPACLMLRSETFRVLSVRAHPAAVWSDLSTVPAPAKPTNF